MLEVGDENCTQEINFLEKEREWRGGGGGKCFGGGIHGNLLNLVVARCLGNVGYESSVVERACLSCPGS